jgi:hypothetical protein
MMAPSRGASTGPEIEPDGAGGVGTLATGSARSNSLGLFGNKSKKSKDRRARKSKDRHCNLDAVIVMQRARTGIVILTR